MSHFDKWAYDGYDENTCPHCGSGGGLILESADDYEAPRRYFFRCEDCGGLSIQVWALVENAPVEG